MISGSRFSAHLAAYMVLLSPEILLSQHQILSEFLFMIFLMLSVWLLIIWQRAGKLIYLMMAFLLLTVATFVRPTSIYMPFLIAGLIFFFLVFSDSIQRKLVTLALVLIALAIHIIAVDSWKDRNFRAVGSTEFTTSKSVLSHEYIAAAIEARGEKKDWSEVRKEYQLTYNAVSIMDRENFSSRKLLENIKKYPHESIKIFLSGFVTNAMDSGFGEWLNFLKLRSKESGIIYKYNNLSYTDFIYFLISNEKLLFLTSFIGLLYMSTLWIGLFFALNRLPLQFPIALMVAVISYVLIISAGPQSLARFRVPVMPLIIAFSAVGLTMLYKKFCKKQIRLHI